MTGSLRARLRDVGICSDAQGRVRELVGSRWTRGLRNRLSGLVGGTSGCAHLDDPTTDLVKPLTLPS